MTATLDKNQKMKESLKKTKQKKASKNYLLTDI